MSRAYWIITISITFGLKGYCRHLKTMPEQSVDIKDLSLDALRQWLEERGYKPFHAGQIFKWIWQRQVDDFEFMTDVGKQLRAGLQSHFHIGRLERVRLARSADGSCKYLFRLMDGNFIESVLIPERGRMTLCISSQVGCAQGCRFCLTGRGGFVRNLTRGEILAQVRDIRRELPDPNQRLNIVLMGMGEPLANYRQVVSAIETLTDASYGLSVSGRRVTLSTAGVAPQIVPLGQETAISLAVSLNAVDNATRSDLMPINRRYPLERLLAACRSFPLKPRSSITFEYILIKGLNDSPDHARRLARLLHPIPAKINLIPFNPFEGCDFQRPDQGAVTAFQDQLHAKHYTTIVRYSKGQDIGAACGQLRVRQIRQGITG